VLCIDGAIKESVRKEMFIGSEKKVTGRMKKRNF
jgi:hypothetical protein